MRKLENEYVQQCFRDDGCEALDPYVNCRTKMKYRCSCGNIAEITFNSFQNGHKCIKCSKIRRHTDEYIQKYYKDRGCEALGPYINSKTKMKFRCMCGNMSEITFNNFQRERRCVKCGIDKRSGKNNPNYNPELTEEERQIRREYPEYKEWRTAVYKRDDYTCQKCKKRGGGTLNAHHIEAYATNKELRTNINNGITFCEDCHNDFHHQYGNECTIVQLQKFLEDK